MKISGKFNIFAGAVFLSFVIMTFSSAYYFEKLRIGGPIYTEVAESQVLLADILPPPFYIVEAYLEIALVNQDLRTIDETRTRLAAYKSAYDGRFEVWKGSVLPDAMKALIAERTMPPVAEFWSLVESDYLPALARADRSAADAAFAALTARYNAHRSAVEDLVQQATALSLSIEVRASSEAVWASALR